MSWIGRDFHEDATPETVLYSGDGEQPRQLPTRWAICGTCQGEGKHSQALGCFTSEEMADQGPEFLQDYLDGAYDAACGPCEGTGKIKRVDIQALAPADQEAYREQLQGEADDRAECEAERRMGC